MKSYTQCYPVTVERSPACQPAACITNACVASTAKMPYLTAAPKSIFRHRRKLPTFAHPANANAPSADFLIYLQGIRASFRCRQCYIICPGSKNEGENRKHALRESQGNKCICNGAIARERLSPDLIICKERLPQHNLEVHDHWVNEFDAQARLSLVLRIQRMTR